MRTTGLLLLACASTIAIADSKADIQSRYVAFNEAVKKNDAKAMQSWVNANCTPDFKYTSKDHQVFDLKQFSAGMLQQVKVTRKVIYSNVKLISWDEKTGVAVVATDYKGSVVFDSKPLTLTDKSETKDVWIKSKGTWKLKSSLQTKAATQAFQPDSK